MSLAIHRDSDSRSCGASTIASGQSSVYINNRLVSVEGDKNSHGGGGLSASNNGGTFFIENKKVVFNGSSASSDSLCPTIGPPHCNPKASGGSNNVFSGG